MGKPVSSTNKTDHHDITEILLKVALNTITSLIKFNAHDAFLESSSSGTLYSRKIGKPKKK